MDSIVVEKNCVDVTLYQDSLLRSNPDSHIGKDFAI